MQLVKQHNTIAEEASVNFDGNDRQMIPMIT